MFPEITKTRGETPSDRRWSLIDFVGKNWGARGLAFLTLILLVSCFVQFSCDRSSRHVIRDKVPLTHVFGVVFVDGVPAEGVHIQYVPQGELAERRERYLNRFFLLSREGGKFSLSTYVDGDGIPYGEYALEFKWLEQRLSGEIDKFGGAYSDPALPFMKIKVDARGDINLGQIRLSTMPQIPLNPSK